MMMKTMLYMVFSHYQKASDKGVNYQYCKKRGFCPEGGGGKEEGHSTRTVVVVGYSAPGGGDHLRFDRTLKRTNFSSGGNDSFYRTFGKCINFEE